MRPKVGAFLFIGLLQRELPGFGDEILAKAVMGAIGDGAECGFLVDVACGVELACVHNTIFL